MVLFPFREIKKRRRFHNHRRKKEARLIDEASKTGCCRWMFSAFRGGGCLLFFDNKTLFDSLVQINWWQYILVKLGTGRLDMDYAA